MASIAADEQDVYPPRVLITVSALTDGDAVTVYRQVAGVRTALRAGSTDAVTGTSFLVLDAELPFGTPVTYLAVVNETDEVTTAPATYDLPDGPDRSRPVFTDAITGQVATAVITSWPEKLYERDNNLFRTADGNTVAVVAPAGQYTGTVELFTDTIADLDNLNTLLKTCTTGVIQVRQGGSYPGVDGYLAVLGHTIARWSQDGTDPRRLIRLTVAESAPWPALLEARGYTYADLADVYTGLTYADLAGDYSTYLELAQAELTP